VHGNAAERPGAKGATGLGQTLIVARAERIARTIEWRNDVASVRVRCNPNGHRGIPPTMNLLYGFAEPHAFSEETSALGDDVYGNDFEV
jgi:hypothetical protein